MFDPAPAFLLADASGSMYLLLSVCVACAAVFGTLLFIARRYKRCPSNRVLVVFGKVSGGRSATCIHGGGRFVLPIIQDYAFMSLEPIQIEVPLHDALSSENIRVNVPSVFTVAIGIEPSTMQNAAIRLLGLDLPHIKKQAEDIIFGQLRQVIASMRIEDINRDREKFLHNIQSSVEPELEKIGLVLINVNITDLTDGSGYIEAIGRKAASEAIQKARGDVAEQEKLGEVRVAEAERDKQIQVAEASKLREIGLRAAKREQAVRVADLNKEQQVGEQRAAFGQNMEVAEADREKRIAVANANAIAFAGEAEAQAKVAEAEARLLVKKAEAFQLGETRRREAEAAVQEAQNRAMAKAALAEAEKVEAERRAAVEAPAKAEKAKIIVAAEAEAEKRKSGGGKARRASAIFARLEAEARGQYEILAKKRARRLPCANDRSLRRSQPGLPDVDDRAPRQAGRNVGQGHLEHQVRQGRGLGKRRQAGRPNVDGQLPPRHDPHPAAHAAGAARHRRRRGARDARQTLAGRAQRSGQSPHTEQRRRVDRHGHAARGSVGPAELGWAYRGRSCVSCAGRAVRRNTLRAAQSRRVWSPPRDCVRKAIA